MTAWLSAGQALPPPRDGEIRALYRELRNETEVWLTIEPRSADGKPGPTGMIVTCTVRFPGKQPKAPPQDIDVRAYAGFLWAPKVEFWLLLDDREKIDLVPPGAVALATDSVSDYLQASVPVPELKRIANAKRVTGNALGFQFELTEPQRQAIRVFIGRVLSDNPAQDRQVALEGNSDLLSNVEPGI